LEITLKAARANKNLSRKEACKLLGISEFTLKSYEDGKTQPTIDMGRLISKVYEIPLNNIKF